VRKFGSNKVVIAKFENTLRNRFYHHKNSLENAYKAPETVEMQRKEGLRRDPHFGEPGGIRTHDLLIRSHVIIVIFQRFDGSLVVIR